MDEIHARPLRVENPPETTVIVSATPLTLASGTVVVLEAYRDVTAEARIQARYKLLLERERERAQLLEEQVRARTADLQRSLDELVKTRAQLIQSEKLSSLGQLVAGIAHEINNPINFVYGNSEFLDGYVAAFLKLIAAYEVCELTADDRQRIDALRKEVDFEYLKTDVAPLVKSMRTGAERAACIIRDLRAFMRGRPHERVPIDLAAGINQTITLLAHETKDRIKIEREGFADAPKVYGNEGQLNQVIMNLLLNAVQAIQGEGVITIRLRPENDGVAIDVQDTGVGISEENLLKVFDPFFTTKPVGQGTGLGLSLSYSIVDAHGGQITVKSEPGKGATFTVWLPCGAPAAKADAQ